MHTLGSTLATNTREHVGAEGALFLRSQQLQPSHVDPWTAPLGAQEQSCGGRSPLGLFGLGQPSLCSAGGMWATPRLPPPCAPGTNPPGLAHGGYNVGAALPPQPGPRGVRLVAQLPLGFLVIRKGPPPPDEHLNSKSTRPQQP